MQRGFADPASEQVGFDAIKHGYTRGGMVVCVTSRICISLIPGAGGTAFLQMVPTLTLTCDDAYRVVKCVQVTPGGPIPSEAEADIWWDQLHNRNHMTFLDPHDWVPTSVKQLKPGQKRVCSSFRLHI